MKNIDPTPSSSWFPGLNGLRFLAAALVVTMHIHNNMGISGLRQLPPFPVLFKGLYAVAFFFVLSGFLITWLLLKERDRTGGIAIKAFYLRRVFRIWPLYFIVLIAGCFFYWRLAPALHLSFESGYPHGLAVLLYAFFMANLMNSLYHVGGILHITWSIAVEEQFYLFWAPLFRRSRERLPALIGTITGISLLLHVCNTLNVFGLSKEVQAFLATLQFHYMGFGACCAWLLYTYGKRLQHFAVFRSKALQCLLLAILVSFFLFYKRTPWGELFVPLPLAFLFGWLILNVSTNPRTVLTLDGKLLNYLGRISYGIYMYHMPVVYATAFVFQRANLTGAGPWMYFPLYFGTVFLVTCGIASLSYAILERPLMHYSKRFQSSEPCQNRISHHPA